MNRKFHVGLQIFYSEKVSCDPNRSNGACSCTEESYGILCKCIEGYMMLGETCYLIEDLNKEKYHVASGQTGSWLEGQVRVSSYGVLFNSAFE